MNHDTHPLCPTCWRELGHTAEPVSLSTSDQCCRCGLVIHAGHLRRGDAKAMGFDLCPLIKPSGAKAA